MSKSIAILFPHPAAGPTGGYKVAMEYANRLAADGYDVHLVYSGSIFWSQKSLFHKLTNCVRYVQRMVQGYSSRGWFPLEPRVKEHFTWSLNYRHVPKADIYIATSPYTAWYLNEYPIDYKRKFYFIQGKEDWGPGIAKILADTYHMPLQKIVISRWLQDMLRNEYGEESIFIPNGFDFNKYRLTVPIEERVPASITMLYHDMELKDCPTGIEALRLVQEQVPQLRAHLFGVPSRPANLPEWIQYTRQPDSAAHLRLNNENAIFLGTSKQEGWGLTVGEAMACGQAVVCTDNPGYREMAVDGRNAIVVPVGDPQAMADAILRLINDNKVRISLAKQAHEDIQQFSWDKSYELLKQTLSLR